jgi:hypothetical protein
MTAVQKTHFSKIKVNLRIHQLFARFDRRHDVNSQKFEFYYLYMLNEQ